MKLKRPHPLFLFLLLLLWPGGQGRCQHPDTLLKRGGACYERDQLDSARIYYQQACEHADADLRLRALTGLLKVAVQASDMTRADSLRQVGDTLSENENADLLTRSRYLLIRGEFLRKNSRFREALAQQKEVARLGKSLPDSTLVRAYAQLYTALCFERLDRYDSSLVYIDRAHELFRQQLDTGSLKFAPVYNSLGVCYYRAGRLNEAENYYLRSMAITEAQIGSMAGDLAVCLNNLSAISRSREDYPQAINYSERALRIYRHLNNESGISDAYYALGVYHYYLGDYGRCRDYMKACIALRERLFSPEHFSLINPYNVLGIALEEAGLYEQTLHYLRKNRRLVLVNYGPGSLAEGLNLENTGICFQSLGHLDSALHYLQLAHTILPEKLSEEDYALGVHYFSYASVCYQRDELREAAPLLDKSQRIYRRLGLDQSSEYAQGLAMKALIRAESGEWEEAESLFDQAMQRIRQPSTTDSLEFSPNALWLLNEYQDFHFRKYLAIGREEALSDFQKYARIYLNYSDDYRKRFMDPYTKSVLIKDNAEVYARNIDVYYHLYRSTGRDSYLRDAYRFSEYGRTCLLRDLQDEKIQSYADLPDSLLQLERRLKKEITTRQQEVMDHPTSPEAEKALFLAKESYNEHIAFMLEYYPRYHDLKYRNTVPALSEVQAQMEKGGNMIEYMQGDTACYALLIQAHRSRLFYLGGREEIAAAVQDWRKQLIARSSEELQEAGRRIHHLLWAPLEDHLEGNRVTLIPAGPLFYLNFETLPLSDKPDQYLIQAYNISYALSLTVLFSPAEPPASGALLAVAPGFEEDIKHAYRNRLDSNQTADKAYLQTLRQPWSLRMVEWIKKRFFSQIFTGLEATEGELKGQLPQGRLLVFGTHAIADAEDPLRSRLLLAKEAGPQAEDGYLHAYELYGLPLQAELAVLNACESGLGRLQRGEGMISLAYSLNYAGCPSTVMSLWKVDEKVSTHITQSFLDYLQQGLARSQALRRAKLDHLENSDPTLSHPFYWGGLVLMGQDGPVELPRKRTWPWFLLGGAAFIALAWLLLRRR